MIRFLFVLVVCAFTQAASAQKNFLDQPYLDITGTADTALIPDEIYLDITISEKDSRDRVSLEEQENRMIAALKSIGINTDSALAVSDMGSNFKNYLLKSRDILKQRQYELKLRTAKSAAEALQKLEEIGIATVNLSRVGHSRLEAVRGALRVSAVRQGHAAAHALAKGLGQSIGAAIYISDAQANILQSNNNIRIREYSNIQAEKSSPADIDFEKIRITATVSMKFVLKP